MSDPASGPPAPASEARETTPPPSGVGSVVLDIGGDIGAAVVTTPAALAGTEVEIRAVDAPWDGTHVAVLERRLPTGSSYAAVFPSLPEGTYVIRVRHRDDDTPTSTFEVRGAQVCYQDWVPGRI